VDRHEIALFIGDCGFIFNQETHDIIRYLCTYRRLAPALAANRNRMIRPLQKLMS